MPKTKFSSLLIHLVLLSYTALALFPSLLMIVNSFKSKEAIFSAPLALPTAQTFDLIGYQIEHLKKSSEFIHLHGSFGHVRECERLEPLGTFLIVVTVDCAR